MEQSTKEKRPLRVAAYIRVSSEHEQQEDSYEVQERYFSSLLSQNPNWISAGIYSDYGISGTEHVHRRGFNRLMRHCAEGRIDRIVCKSISRFARNTTDFLTAIRVFQENSVKILFEKENIDTLDAKGELVLTILSALAQEESRSISDNIKWTIQKNFKIGKAHLSPNRIIGYCAGNEGEWEIEPEQAELVRAIFREYIAGKSATQIAKNLNERGLRTGLGKRWRSDSVLYVLRNEKYVGDCEMQKYVTENYLTHRCVQNEGQMLRYYFTDHHAPIIDRDTWEKTKMMLEAERPDGCYSEGDSALPHGSRRAVRLAFSNLTCGCCGGKLKKFSYKAPLLKYTDARSEGFDPKTETEAYTMGYGVWRCERTIGTNRAKEICKSDTLIEQSLRQSFMEMLYRTKRDYEENGEASDLMRQFHAVIEREKKINKEYLYEQEQIREQTNEINRLLREKEELTQRRREVVSFAANEELELYDQLLDDLEWRIEESSKALKKLEQGNGLVFTMQKNFKIFLNCLASLPETNPAGARLNINTIDVQGSFLRSLDGDALPEPRKKGNVRTQREETELLAEAPDLLAFDKRVYMAFIERGIVMENHILLKTIFGVELRMELIRRPLAGFLGFRRGYDDGSVELLTKRWQITERKIGYRRRKR